MTWASALRSVSTFLSGLGLGLVTPAICFVALSFAYLVFCFFVRCVGLFFWAAGLLLASKPFIPCPSLGFCRLVTSGHNIRLIMGALPHKEISFRCARGALGCKNAESNLCLTRFMPALPFPISPLPLAIGLSSFWVCGGGSHIEYKFAHLKTKQRKNTKSKQNT